MENDVDAKISRTFGTGNFPLYDNILERLGEKEVKYILIHGNGTLSNYLHKHIIVHRNNEEVEIYCFSFIHWDSLKFLILNPCENLIKSELVSDLLLLLLVYTSKQFLIFIFLIITINHKFRLEIFILSLVHI